MECDADRRICDGVVWIRIRVLENFLVGLCYVVFGVEVYWVVG